MSYTEETRRNAREIRHRLRFPPNAVKDTGFDITKKSSGIKGWEVEKPIPLPPKPARAVAAEEYHRPWPLTLNMVVNAVATHYGVCPDDLKGSTRLRRVSHARRMVIYLGIKLLKNRTMNSMATELNKHHTTILYARDEMERIMPNSAPLRAIAEHIERVLIDGHYH